MSEASVTDVYERFKVELDRLTIMADAPAAAVVGECLRAVKRAQTAFDETSRPGVERLVAALRGLLEGIDRVEPILSGITTHHQLRTGTRYTPDEISCESEIAAARAALAEFGSNQRETNNERRSEVRGVHPWWR